MRAARALAFLLAFAGLVRAQALEESTLREKLGAEDASVRDRVTRQLHDRRSAFTAADLEVLERLTRDADAEVAARSRGLLAAARRIQRMPRELQDLLAKIRGRTGMAEVRSGDFQAVACLWGSGDLDDAQVEDWLEEVADLAWAPPGSEELRLIGDLGAAPFGRRIARFVAESDENNFLRHDAANALAAAGCANEEEALARLLDAKWPLSPLPALKAIGTLRTAALRGLVLDFAASPQAETRAAAAFALGGIADPRDLDRLQRLAGDADPRVRAAAATALSNYGGTAPVPLLESMLDDPDQDCVHAAAGALASLGSKASAVKIASRCARFTDSWFQLQDALIALDNDDAIPILFDIAEREPGRLAETALVGIWKLRDASDTKRLLALLEEPGRGRRLHVAWALDQTRPEGFEDRFIALLADDDPEVRGYAALVCQTDVIRRAAPGLRNLLNSANPGVRWQAEMALTFLGLSDAGPAIRRQVDSSERSERLDGAHKASILGDRSTVAGLQHLLRSPSSDERAAAALALGKCPDPSSIAQLLTLRTDDDPAVRFRAVEALINLGHAEDVREWVRSTPPDGWKYGTAPYNLLRRPDCDWALSALLSSLRSRRWPLDWRTLAHMDAATGGDWPEAAEIAHVHRLRTLAGRKATVISRGARVELVKRGLIPRSAWREILEKEANVNPLWWGQKEVCLAFGMAENPETVRRLRTPEMLAEDIADEEDFARLLKSRGIEFEPGPFRIRGRFSSGREISPLELIHITEMDVNDMAIVIEKDRVRGMRTRDAAAYWRAKLQR